MFENLQFYVKNETFFANFTTLWVKDETIFETRVQRYYERKSKARVGSTTTVVLR